MFMVAAILLVLHVQYQILPVRIAYLLVAPTAVIGVAAVLGPVITGPAVRRKRQRAKDGYGEVMIRAGFQFVVRLISRNGARGLSSAMTPTQRNAAGPESAITLRAKPALTANVKFAAATRSNAA